jgi:hypothetical protein
VVVPLKKYRVNAQMGTTKLVEFTVEAFDRAEAYRRIQERLNQDGMWPKGTGETISVRFWEVVA